MSTRHNSIDALRESYQRSRLQQQSQQSIGGSDLLSSSPVVPTTVFEEEEEEEEEKEKDEDFEETEGDDDDYSMYSDSSSIPDENINFDLVYALHTFVATVDGQASVVKGDAMTLLDDSNSYWWLIRALKASEVGYIPAENIETPFERLARLNKHRNVQVTSLDQLQHYSPAAAAKRTRSEKKKVKVSRDLKCQLQIILMDEDNASLYEEEFEKWEEEMSSLSFRESSGDEEEEDQNDNNSSSNKSKSAAETKKDNNKKYTPLLNPDFNKPINIVSDSTSLVEKKDIRITPSPKLSVEKVKPAAVISKEKQPAPITHSQQPQQIEQEQQQPSQSQQQSAQKVVTGLKRLLSIGSGSSKKNKPSSNATDLGISSSSFQQQQQQEDDDKQYHVLRIFSGNINVGAMFNTVAVTPDMNADQLLKLALQKFHIPLLEESSSNHRRPSSENGIEYYLTVKSMDGDEITLEPQDKPLAIFESLSDHLTTPMPSLTYIKRLSIEQPTIKVTRVGVSKARQRAKARFGEDSVIRFSLHKRIKRTIDTAAGQIYVKMSFYAENNNQLKNIVSSGSKISTMGLIRKSSLLRVDQQIQQQQQQLLLQKAKQERIDKLVAISTTTLISDLTKTALEKFHMINEDRSLYYMSLSLNGKETPLEGNKTISEILIDSELIPKGTVEKLFVLRKKNSVNNSTSSASSIPVVIPATSISETESTNRFVRFLKHQDHTKEVHAAAAVEDVSSAGNVLKRLDQAIQSLENDKRQLDKFQYNESSPAPPPPLMKRSHQSDTSNTSKARMVPVRSNSLSAMSSSYRSNPKIAPVLDNQTTSTKRLPPTRSSSLKISGDVFDSVGKSSLSNMDDLEMELKRIASSHGHDM